MAEDAVIRVRSGVPVEADFENIVTRDGGFTRIYFVVDSTTGRPYTRLSDGTIQPLSLGTGVTSGTNTGDVTLAGTPTYLTIAGQVITLGNVPTSAITGLSSYLLVADIDDTPVNGELAAPISSNWAFDHVAASDPHPGYLTPAEGDAAYAPIAKGVTNGDSHDHSGGDGAQVSHTTLSNIGSNTHAQIDTHIAATGTSAHGLGTASTQSYTEAAWSATPAPASGSFTTISFTGTYTRIGRLVHAQAVFTITDKGTAAGTLLVALPATPGAQCVVNGWEDNAVGVGVSGTSTGSDMELRRTDGGTMYVNGAKYVLSVQFYV